MRISYRRWLMVIIRIVDFPDCSANAMVIRDCNGDDNIYLNARMSYESQMQGFKHEMIHSINDDIESGLSVSEIEMRIRDEHREAG